MRYAKPRNALLADLGTVTILAVVIVSVLVFQAGSPAEGQADTGRAHDDARGFTAPLLL